ncbi:hypothetical protein J529_4144 [Acinetobacter baumannii 99063]|uniref:Uncharacterized protein n=1 Tax=Acinetobacter baumannii 99063 TaxID=1310630 RepID=A0A009RNI5_ACIBA|nr:hypothetical protein J529_4169 [Acinetobacter baumannii 99063]EXC43066.1 hypothetical protein J529_4144 [Acinetobacter baumannii 99063]
MFFDPKLNLFKSDAYIFMQQSPFQLLEREPALNELAEIKKYFLSIFPDSVYQLA